MEGMQVKQGPSKKKVFFFFYNTKPLHRKQTRVHVVTMTCGVMTQTDQRVGSEVTGSEGTRHKKNAATHVSCSHTS